MHLKMQVGKEPHKECQKSGSAEQSKAYLELQRKISKLENEKKK